jgi:hypothetical protein
MCLDARYVHATRTAYTSLFENSGLVVPNCAPEHICHCVVKKTVIKAAKRFPSGFLKFSAIASWRMYVLRRRRANIISRAVLLRKQRRSHLSLVWVMSFVRSSYMCSIPNQSANREPRWLPEKPALKIEQWSDAITIERMARLTRPAR